MIIKSRFSKPFTESVILSSQANHRWLVSISPKVPCMSHGPSKTPLLDRDLQKPQTQEIIHAISSALEELVDEKKCTRCTVEDLSTLLTEQIRNLREAKQNGVWSKEERKAMKAETKSLLKPVKKQLKGLWKAN